MKAFWIDTPNAQIVEVEYDGNWRTIAPQWLKCDLFTVVGIDRKQNVVFVDDEGLINDNPHGWFVLKHYNQPLRGYGLVLGTDNEGDSIAPTLTLDELKALVHFPTYVNEALIDKTIKVRPI